MIPKTKEKELALGLRRQGLSYREILQKVPVAKSTLSLWLRSVGLSKRQKQRLTEKKLAAMRRGWAKIRLGRTTRIETMKSKARKEVSKLLHDPLWILGTGLYWGEGSKMKKWRRGERVSLSNMDVNMILLFRQWLQQYFHIDINNITYELYLHRNAEHRLQEIKAYWGNLLKISSDVIRVYFKSANIKPKRKNIGNSYFGVLRIKVPKSSTLNHRITGWIEELSEKYCGVVQW